MSAVSTYNIVARVVANTGLSDGMYAPYIPEWVNEAYGLLPLTRGVKEPRYVDAKVDFYKAKAPCGRVDIRAVEYKGRRLRRGFGSRSMNSVEEPTSDNVRNSACSTMAQVMKLKEDGQLWYEVSTGGIDVALKSGTIRIHYYAEPCDEYGFPFIPDNENLKEAIYYYVRAKLIGAGWEDKVFKYDACMQYHERYLARATELDMPHVDEMEDKVDNLVRLFPREDFFDSFFESSKKPVTKDTNVVGVPVAALITERLAAPTAAIYQHKFASGFSFTFTAEVHQLDKVKGASFFDPDGNVALVAYSVTAGGLVTVSSDVDLLNYTMTLF